MAQGDFLSSPRSNCQAAHANLAQMFTPRIPLTDMDRFFSVFTRTCEAHRGSPLPGFPVDVLDGEVPKRIHAAWFEDGGEEDAVLVAAIATKTGKWDLFSTLEGTWQLELVHMLKPLVGAMRKLKERQKTAE